MNGIDVSTTLDSLNLPATDPEPLAFRDLEFQD